MIKKIIALVVALVMLCTGAVFFSACGYNRRKFSARALFSKNILELPIVGGVSDPVFPYRDVELSIDEIFAKISSDKSLTVKLIDRKIFISKDNGDGTKDYFIISEVVTSREKNSYHFSDMRGEGSYLMLIPYHLFDMQGFECWYDEFSFGGKYKTKFDVGDFFEFYNNSGWYDVERGEEYIQINGYKDEEKVYALNNALQFPLKYINFQPPLKFEFKSGDEPGVNFFTTSYHYVVK